MELGVYKPSICHKLFRFTIGGWECASGAGGEYGTGRPPQFLKALGPAADNALAPVGSHISAAGMEHGK